MTKPHKTLIFHIGDHKTGSTAIQLAFARRQVSLTGRTVFYPAKLEHNMLRPHFRAYGTYLETPARKTAITVFQELANKIRKSDADFCLISAEHFEEIDADVFLDIVTRFFADAADDIRIVAYVRPHTARIISSFSERIKIGGLNAITSGPEFMFQQMYRENFFPYHARFSALRNKFGTSFLLRPMIRSQLHKGSVVDDFIHHAFGQSEYQLMAAAPANESLTVEDLMRLKVLHSHLRHSPSHLRHTLGWEFARMVSALPPHKKSTKLRLHKALAKKIKTRCFDDAIAMDKDFFDGVPLLQTELQRAVKTAVRKPQPITPEDYLSSADIRSLTIMSEMIAGMLENQNGDWPRFLHKRRLEELFNNKTV